MTEPVDIEQWLLNKAKQFEDQQAPRNLVEGMRNAAKTIVKLRDEVQTWIVHANNAIWSDSEECKLLAADNERLRAVLKTSIQFMSIATDWNLDKVEIDGKWRSTYDLIDEATAALAGEKQ